MPWWQVDMSRWPAFHFKHLEWSSTAENTGFFFFMVSSTKSSVCKRLFSQLTPCFIGSSFMLVLCIRDRVSRSSSPSMLLCLETMDKVPYMVEGLLVRSKDYIWIGFWFNGQHWHMADSEGKHGTSLHMALLGVFG